nr:reverse transcriptase domain-containing protein [Tanacetum cinerariifolium]
DYDVDPQFPIILGRPFLGMTHALVDVHDEELTLQVSDEKLVFNVERTLKYPQKHVDELINMINILDTACEDNFHEEKVPFHGQREHCLGHKISKNGIEVDRAKVDVIAKIPPLTTVKGIRSFLGHTSFYRRFLQNSSAMTHLLEKDTIFFFSYECQSFEILKKKLTEAPILVSPYGNLSFEVMCDASDFVVGADLGQRKDKYFRPIHYASNTLSDAQAHYTTTEKELLAMCTRLRNYGLTLSYPRQ